MGCFTSSHSKYELSKRNLLQNQRVFRDHVYLSRKDLNMGRFGRLSLDFFKILEQLRTLPRIRIRPRHSYLHHFLWWKAQSNLKLWMWSQSSLFRHTLALECVQLIPGQHIKSLSALFYIVLLRQLPYREDFLPFLQPNVVLRIWAVNTKSWHPKERIPSKGARQNCWFHTFHLHREPLSIVPFKLKNMFNNLKMVFEPNGRVSKKYLCRSWSVCLLSLLIYSLLPATVLPVYKSDEVWCDSDDIFGKEVRTCTTDSGSQTKHSQPSISSIDRQHTQPKNNAWKET